MELLGLIPITLKVPESQIHHARPYLVYPAVQGTPNPPEHLAYFINHHLVAKGGWVYDTDSVIRTIFGAPWQAGRVDLPDRQLTSDGDSREPLFSIKEFLVMENTLDGSDAQKLGPGVTHWTPYRGSVDAQSWEKGKAIWESFYLAHLQKGWRQLMEGILERSELGYAHRWRLCNPIKTSVGLN